MPRKKKETVSPEITAGPKNVGRPTIYSKEIGNLIFEAMSDGSDLVSVCKLPGMPHRTTVYVWMDKYPEFKDMIGKGRGGLADFMASKIHEIAQTAKPENSSADSIKLQAYKWLTSKISPKVYGDKVQTEVSGVDGSAIKVETVALDVASLSPESRAALRAALLEAKSKK
jgi:hypothetical protein